MDRLKLEEFLGGRLTADEFHHLISEEVEQSKELCKKGAAGPVHLWGKNADFLIDNRHVMRVLEGYVSGDFNEWDVYYILTALELDETFRFKNEKIEEIISALSDPAANGPISIEIAREAIFELSVLG